MPQHADQVEIRFSTISYLVLGLIDRHGPCTSYQLKSLAAGAIGHLWPQPHAQLYAEPARLAQHGLLQVTVERGGRRRHYYQSTPAGRQRLDAWLNAGDVDGLEFQDPALIKLTLLATGGGETDRARLRSLARDRAIEHRRRWAALRPTAAEASDQRPAEPTGHIRRLASDIEHTAAEFWTSLAGPTTAAELAHPVHMPDQEHVEHAFTRFWLLANPIRIKLLWALLQGESSVSLLAGLVDSTPEAVSQHLTKLAQFGLVRIHRDGGQVLLLHDGAQLRNLLTEALRA